MRAVLPIVLCALALPLRAAGPDDGAEVRICYNYGCVREEPVSYRSATLDELSARLAAAGGAARERELLAEAVGRLYRLAGEQLPVAADRRGNYLDGGVDGRMDCIDHSTSTTRMLRLLESRGALRFHRVSEPGRRTWFIFQHFSAVIEELAPACGSCMEDGMAVEEPDGGEAPPPGKRYAVDSWFVDNGEAAIVLPLAEWLNGGGPNVQ